MLPGSEEAEREVRKLYSCARTRSVHSAHCAVQLYKQCLLCAEYLHCSVEAGTPR